MNSVKKICKKKKKMKPEPVFCICNLYIVEHKEM